MNRDNFHIVMRMRTEPHTGGNMVVVDYAQGTEVCLLGIVIVGKEV